MTYFISDTHLGHAAIIGVCRRPFASVEAMDEAIIHNWNQTVKRGDTVYILGDLMHKNRQDPAAYLARLKGKKILIRGNHDDGWLARLPDPSAYLEDVSAYREITLGGRAVTLCHYPMLEWKNSRKVGSRKLGYLIHGHTHVRTDEMYAPLFKAGHALNAGADINGFFPVTFDELVAHNERFKLAHMPSRVAQARFLAGAYHMHQCDKAGDAYIHHLLHVAAEVEGEETTIVALLHDTLEDTTLSPALIEELFGEIVLAAIRALTRDPGEDYEAYIARVKKNPIARAVKAADLRHNMDLSRLKTVTDADRARRDKYARALAELSI